MEAFDAYGHAIASVVIWAVLSNLLNAAVGITKGGKNMAPGSAFEPADYANPSWRLDRAYMNTVEMGTFYIALVVAAILAGANPLWVNWLASIGLLCRLAAIFIYMRGIGKAYGGIRTGFAIIASIANIVMALIALAAVF